MENNEQNAAKASAKKGIDEIKEFYKGDFIDILVQFFKHPTNGVSTILKNPSEKSFINSMIIFGSVFVLYIVGAFILTGDARQYMNFFDFIKMGIFPLVCMLIISLLSFAIKTISGKPVFKNELLTGALCGIPFGLLIPIMLIIKLLMNDKNMLSLISNPAGSGILGILFIFYILLMLISVFQQSLKSAGTKESLAWYLSPVSILFAIYLTGQILY